MLIRFVVNNLFSFGEEKEFNMLPMPRLRKLNKHKYEIKGCEVLKLSSIYGANGAGKSNLIKSLFMLQELVVNPKKAINFSRFEYKFNKIRGKKPTTLVVEFSEEGEAFLYGVEIINNIIVTEELYLSGLGNDKNDKLIYKRSTDAETKKISIESDLLDISDEGKLLKSVIEKNFSKPKEPIFKLLTDLDNDNLKIINTAYKWFSKRLQIVTPSAKPVGLAHRVDKDEKFRKYTEDTMCSFALGISGIYSKKRTLKSFLGEDDKSQLDDIIASIEDSSTKVLQLNGDDGSEIILTKEGDEFYAKNIIIQHSGKGGRKADFELTEESDGTVRLLDFIPAFQGVIKEQSVLLIDEIERSLHPLLIKELISKFSNDDRSNGQLIFTTHESNLLDQDIFRQDEIWFSEKDKNGCTDLYTLSDFKEHNTIDIRKGYLTGRYGSIPFLSNLTDLKWH